MKHVRLSLTAFAVVTLATGTFTMTAHAQTPSDAAALTASEVQSTSDAAAVTPTETTAMTDASVPQAAPGVAATDEGSPVAPSAPVAPPQTGDSASGGTPPATPSLPDSAPLASTPQASPSENGASEEVSETATAEAAPVVTVTRMGETATIENASAAPASTVTVFAPPIVDSQAVSFVSASATSSTLDLSMTARAIDAGMVPVVNFSR